MAQVLLNGTAVLHMELHRPRIGPWFALVDLDGTDVPSGKATINVGDGALVLVGTVQPERSGAFVERVRVRIVGGAGGLRKILGSKFYGPGASGALAVKLPLSEIASSAGESLSGTSDAATLAALVPCWPRLGVAAHEALSSLAVEKLGVAWRTLDDGTIWVGPESWPEASIDYAIQDEDFIDRRFVIATDDPTLRPGTSLDGRRVSYLIYTFSPDETRVTAWIDLDARDRMRSGIGQYVRSLVAPKIDPLAKYAATVVRQSADGTLELKPDAGKLPGLTNVPIRSAFPGVNAKVSPGTRCDVSFEDGDISKPVVVAFAADGLLELRVTAKTQITVDSPLVRIADGDIPIARAGDLVTVMLPVGVVPGAGGVVWMPVPSGQTAFGVISSGSSKGKVA